MNRWRTWKALRRSAPFVVVAGVMLAIASAAQPVITPTNTASSLAGAITVDASIVTGASLPAVPPSGTPNAVADSGTALGGFPTAGTTYTILTSGDANLADDPNDSDGSGADLGGG